jgi:hypothetical protein
MNYYASSPLSHIKSIAHNKTDEKFLKKLDDEILKNITDPDLSVESSGRNHEYEPFDFIPKNQRYLELKPE